MMAAVVAGRGSSLEEDSVTEEGLLLRKNSTNFCYFSRNNNYNLSYLINFSESYRSDIAKPKKVRKKRPTEKNEEKMTVKIKT